MAMDVGFFLVRTVCVRNSNLGSDEVDGVSYCVTKENAVSETCNQAGGIGKDVDCYCYWYSVTRFDRYGNFVRIFGKSV